MAADKIRKVPIKTPMFEEDFVDGTMLRHLTRTWIIFFEQLLEAVGTAGAPGTPGAPGTGPYVRTLLLKDTTIGDDVADHVPIFQAGPALRAIGVLRKAITADLVVRVNLNTPPGYAGGAALVTLTIPHTTAIDHPVVETTFTPSDFPDLAVLSWDVTASDGSVDADGIASVTVSWEAAAGA